MNVHATATVASASRAAGVEQFIHMSSGGVYGNGRTSTPHRETDRPQPGNAYERSKLAAEEVLTEQLSHGRTTFTMLRSAGIYGHGRAATRAFFDEVRRRRYWVHGSPNVLVHPTHVTDVVQACRLVLDRPYDSPKVVNIGGERALPFQEYIALVAVTLDVSIRQWVMPSRVGAPAARAVASALRLIGSTARSTSRSPGVSSISGRSRCMTGFVRPWRPCVWTRARRKARQRSVSIRSRSRDTSDCCLEEKYHLMVRSSPSLNETFGSQPSRRLPRRLSQTRL
jgi:nucleoside-diphosphate-sugar epimerase